MNSGLYFLQSVIVVKLNVNKIIYSKVVVYFSDFVLSNFLVFLISVSLGVFMVLSVFGVLYLWKGQKVFFCIGLNKVFINLEGLWFFMVRFLVFVSQFGFFQIIKDVQNNFFYCNQLVIKYVFMVGD